MTQKRLGSSSPKLLWMTLAACQSAASVPSPMAGSPSTRGGMQPLLCFCCCLLALLLLAVPQLSQANPLLLTEDGFDASGSIFDRSLPSPSSAPEATMVYCPDLLIPNPAQPVAPTNYTFLSKPILKPGGNYSAMYLIDAIHSLNPSWFYQRVICKYAACPSYGCATVALLSDAVYTHPDAPQGDWGKYLRINDTLICAPNDHLTMRCPFG